jgi:hypothetical protein
MMMSWRNKHVLQPERAGRAAQPARSNQETIMDDNTQTKQCAKCKAHKPLTAFTKRRNTKDGLYCYCRACVQAKGRIYQAENADAIRARRRARYAANREQVQEQHRRYYAERGRFCQRAYYAANAERIRAQRRMHRAANREKACEARRQYRIKNAEKCRAYMSAYRATKAEQIRCQRRVYYAANAERLRTVARAWRHAHLDHVKKHRNEHRRQNRERIKAVRRAYEERNRERIQTRNREYKRRDPIANRIREHRRRARKRAAGGHHTAAQWRALCDFFGNVCLCCGAAGNLSIDHVIPISRGGNDDITNVQPLCLPCNQSKRDQEIDYRDPERLAAFLATLQGGLNEDH